MTDMNPNVDMPPVASVPEQPRLEVAGGEHQMSGAPETAALERGEHLASQPGQQSTGASLMTLPSQQPVQAMSPSGAPVPAALTTPTVAADNDKIEHEWVLKAKEIVAATRQDPFQQNRQLAAIKADYVKKRYNKTVKLSD